MQILCDNQKQMVSGAGIFTHKPDINDSRVRDIINKYFPMLEHKPKPNPAITSISITVNDKVIFSIRY